MCILSVIYLPKEKDKTHLFGHHNPVVQIWYRDSPALKDSFCVLDSLSVRPQMSLRHHHFTSANQILIGITSLTLLFPAFSPSTRLRHIWCTASRRRSLICRAESLIHRRRVTGRAHRSMDFLYHHPQIVCMSHWADIPVMSNTRTKQASGVFVCLNKWSTQLLLFKTPIPIQPSLVFVFFFLPCPWITIRKSKLFLCLNLWKSFYLRSELVHANLDMKSSQ